MATSHRRWLVHTRNGRAAYLDFIKTDGLRSVRPDSDSTTGHHAPLFTSPANPKHDSAANSVSHYIAAGMPPAELVLGVPFYGEAWAMCPPPGIDLPARRSHQNPDSTPRPLPPSTRTWKTRTASCTSGITLLQLPYLYNADRRISLPMKMRIDPRQGPVRE